MPSVRLVPVLISLLPVAAFGHGANGHPPDPNLHVDPSLEECSVKFAPELTQTSFARFAREFGSVSAFKLMSSPRTLGRLGFEISLEHMWFSVEDKSDAWNDTFAHPDAYHELGSDLAFPKISLRAGVTQRLDVGAFFAKAPSANYGWLGLDAKYQLLEQGATMPIALAVRGAYTKTLFVDDMDMHAATADVVAGRTFWGAVTPYVGLGGDLVLARETSPMVELDTEVAAVAHALLGLDVRLWHVSVGAEANLATISSLQARVSATF